MNENLVDDISNVGNGNVNQEGRKQMDFGLKSNRIG